MVKSFDDLKKTVDDRTFKYEVMLSFWLSVHLLKLDEAKILLNLDSLMGKVVSNLREHGQILLKKKRIKEKLK